MPRLEPTGRVTINWSPCPQVDVESSSPGHVEKALREAVEKFRSSLPSQPFAGSSAIVPTPVSPDHPMEGVILDPDQPVTLYPSIATLSFTDDDGDTLTVVQDTIHGEPRIILWVTPGDDSPPEGVALTPTQMVELGEHLIDQGQDLLP